MNKSNSCSLETLFVKRFDQRTRNLFARASEISSKYVIRSSSKQQPSKAVLTTKYYNPLVYAQRQLNMIKSFERTVKFASKGNQRKVYSYQDLVDYPEKYLYYFPNYSKDATENIELSTEDSLDSTQEKDSQSTFACISDNKESYDTLENLIEDKFQRLEDKIQLLETRIASEIKTTDPATILNQLEVLLENKIYSKLEILFKEIHHLDTGRAFVPDKTSTIPQSSAPTNQKVSSADNSSDKSTLKLSKPSTDFEHTTATSNFRKFHKSDSIFDKAQVGTSLSPTKSYSRTADDIATMYDKTSFNNSTKTTYLNNLRKFPIKYT